MQHPAVFRPAAHAVFDASKMRKPTLFASPRLSLGLEGGDQERPVVQIHQVEPVALETGGGRVGQVVGHHVHAGLLCTHAGGR